MEASKTTDIIKDMIDNDIFLQDLLEQGLINYSALARKIFPDVKKQNPKANIASLVVYIKRYADALEKKKVSKRIIGVLALVELLMKNDMVQITFEKDAKVFDFLKERSHTLHLNLGEMFFIIQGTEEISIFLSKSRLEIFRSIFKQAIDITKRLGIIVMKEPLYTSGKREFSRDVTGHLAFLTSLLAKNGINIIEIASNYSQVMFVIQEKDLTKAYDLLDRCIKRFRNS